MDKSKRKAERLSLRKHLPPSFTLLREVSLMFFFISTAVPASTVNRHSSACVRDVCLRAARKA